MAYPDVPLWLELSRLGLDFLGSGVQSLVPDARLKQIERYCFFMGAPRTGHSLIGSLLDAHPDAVIAHELGAPKYLAAHFRSAQIQRLVLANSKRHAASGRRHIHYSHAVEGQWQGRCRELRVIGDKHGEGFLLSVEARPWLAEAVNQSLSPAVFIHVVRHPMDAVASVVGSEIRGHTVTSAIKYFDRLYGQLKTVQQDLATDQVYTLKFENFLARPAEELKRLCGWLGLSPSDDYLEACAAIVIREPDDHRGLVDWDADSRDRMSQLIGRYEWLGDYSID